MDLKFLLCFIIASPVFGDGYGHHTQNANPLVDFDRARSAWNFGGTHPMRSRQWIRPKNTAGHSAIISRRMGEMKTNAWNLPSTTVYKRSPSSPAPSIRSRQSKPYQKVNRPKNKPLKLTKFNRNSSTSQQQHGYHHAINPRHNLNNGNKRSGLPKTMSSLKRGKRSTDQLTFSPVQTPAHFSQMFDMNSRMSSAVGGLRKHFSNHVGNGKNQRPMNLKVPATIIAPPQFDKTDVLEMLLGSGGVDPKEMGTVLATNSRYVRFGRGMPSRDSSSTRTRGRGGRALLWFSDLPTNNFYSQSLPSPPAPQPVLTSNPPQSNPIPAKTQPLPVQQFQAQPPPKLAPSPTITIHPSPPSPTPTISLTPQVKPTVSANTAPNVILNVQISPPAPVRAPPPPPQQSSGPIITLSHHQQPQQQQQVPPQQQEHSYQYQTLPIGSSGKSKKKDNFKYSEYWAPVTKEQAKPQKPYSYDYDYLNNNDVYESADSKVSYQKAKPEKKKNKKKSKKYSKYYDNIDNNYSFGYSDDIINDPYSYSGGSKTKTPEYYETSNSVPESQDMSSLLNYYNGNTGENEYNGDSMDMSTTTTTLNWNDLTTPSSIAIAYDLPPSESNYFGDSGYSYAVKKESEENHNSNLNNVYYIDSTTVGAFTNDDTDISEGASGKSSLRLQENPYSVFDIEEDNDVDGSRKYYMVKKLQIQDPIIVHVPKDSLSNEIK